jgi:hypothetical protein
MKKIIRAKPWGAASVTGRTSWQFERKFHVHDKPVSRAQAQAHMVLVGNPMSIIREGMRGPKGGQGTMHFNANAEWPTGWIWHRHYHWWLIVEDVTFQAACVAAQPRVQLQIDLNAGAIAAMKMQAENALEAAKYAAQAAQYHKDKTVVGWLKEALEKPYKPDPS